MIKIQTSKQQSGYDVKIGSGVLGDAGAFFRKRLGKDCQRVAIISNKRVARLYGDTLANALTTGGFEVSSFNVGDGERSKTLKTAEAALRFLSESSIGRTDAVAALGGGVVGDLAGFAAGIHLRGILYIQVPTTIVAMVDSSVGGKTGVNSTAGKNTVGTFHHPSGVLIDTAALNTLPEREVTAGLCEMIKHAAIAGTSLFDSTFEWLGTRHDKTAQKRFLKLLTENIAFKASIVAGDPREDPANRSASSRKILNFGHTLAHALEKATNYRYFRHGEAVGYGILFAAELSNYLALLDRNRVNCLYDVVHRAGSLPPIRSIDEKQVFEAFRFDKKNIGGKLQFVLLKDIGKPVIVDGGDIPAAAVRQAYKSLLKNLA